MRYVWVTSLFSRILFITKAVFCGEQRNLRPWGRQRGKYSSFSDLFSFRYHYVRKAQRLSSVLNSCLSGIVSMLRTCLIPFFIKEHRFSLGNLQCFIVVSWLDWSTSLQVWVFEMKICCDPCFSDMGVVMYLP